MSVVTLPRGVARQPQGIARLNASRLANNVLAAWTMLPFGTQIHDARRFAFTSPAAATTNAVSAALDPTGSYVSFPGGASDATNAAYYNVGASPLAGRSAGAVSFWYFVTSSARSFAAMGDDNAADNNSSIEYFAYTSGNFWARSYIGGVQKTVSGGSVALNTWHQTVVTYDGAAFALWADGALIQSTAASGAMGNASTNLVLGRRSEALAGGNGYWPLPGGLQNIAFFDRGLSPSEIVSLYRDPWQLYTPAQRRVYLPSTFNPAWAASRGVVIGAGVY